MNEQKLAAEVQAVRTNEHNIHPLFLNRWSQRAMTGEDISEAELLPLFEAARWAPSSYNGQPWRFIYAHRDTPEWQPLFDLLVEGNQTWCQNAAVLVLVLSRQNFERNGKPERTHSFDTGAAGISMALEGEFRGLVVHGMEGFNYEAAYDALHIPHDHTVEAMFAIGKRAPKSSLSPELQEREKPSTRKPLSELLMKGKFDPTKKYTE